MAHVTFDDSLAHDDWAWVPLELPDRQWASAQHWAQAVGDALAGDVVDERDRWRASAQAVIALPVPAPDVVGRVWHTAPGTGTLAVGHLRLGPADDVDAGECALEGLHAGALQRLVDLEHPRLEGAVHTVAVGETVHGTMLGMLRWSGTHAGSRIMLEVVHPELQRLALAEQAFAALFASIGLAEA